jgi:hypothetical protein
MQDAGTPSYYESKHKRIRTSTNDKDTQLLVTNGPVPVESIIDYIFL